MTFRCFKLFLRNLLMIMGLFAIIGGFAGILGLIAHFFNPIWAFAIMFGGAILYLTIMTTKDDCEAEKDLERWNS